MKSFRLVTKILCNVFAVIFGFTFVGGQIANDNASAINAYLGIATQVIEQNDQADEQDPEYFKTSYSSIADLRVAGTTANKQMVEEGAVLLKNENDALPLETGNTVSLFSSSSVNSVISGCGSGGVSTSAVALATSLFDGLTEAGLTVNETLWNWYKSNTQYFNDGKYSSRGNNSQTCTFTIKDANWAQVDESKNNSVDAAVFVLARNGGENADMPQAGSSSGDYLALTDNERSVLEGLKNLKDNGAISKIIVLMNSANQVACDFVNDARYGVDALLWCGTLGTSGAVAVGNILVGAVNPSGRLSDTFWFDHSQNPVYANYGVSEYANSAILPKINTASNPGESNGANRNYTVYQEGIYNGYRYTETRYEDSVLGVDNVGDYDYAKVVSYPFGYGLSYTDFAYSDLKVTKSGEGYSTKYTVSVRVVNTGDVSGKDVVEVYLQKPYTDYDKLHGVEKASAELVGFTKTLTLQPNESCIVTVDVDERLFAAYDSYFAKTYVIGSTNANDMYYLTVGSDAHQAVNNILASKSKSLSDGMTEEGDADLVYSTHIDFSNTKYATNAVIDKANKGFSSQYSGQTANFGISSITNAFDDVDVNLYDTTGAVGKVVYTTRSDWNGTTGLHVTLTATEQMLADMTYTQTIDEDGIDYPTLGAENNLTLADLRAYDDGTPIPYDNELWDKLLDQLSWDDYVTLLSNGLRCTVSIDSINKPATYEQNGPVGPVQKYGSNQTGSAFQGYANEKNDPEKGTYPSIYTCNGIVASSFNVELIVSFGEIQGEECLWAGYNGIYGLGMNIHRGAYNGRAFEYYSEDGYLTGVAAGYESLGIQSKGVYVISKHAVLNDQETCRHNGCSWANEQTIREIYLLPFEYAVKVGNTSGVMTGLNRLGTKWTSEQGFCNTVLRAEFGLEGIIITDFYKPDYMTLVRSLMGGTNLPDGTVTSSTKNQTLQNLANYSSENGNYGALAWAMRESAHRILYTVVHSNAMNFMTASTRIRTIVPTWQKVVKAVTIVSGVALALSCCGYLATVVCASVKKRKEAVNNG